MAKDHKKTKNKVISEENKDFFRLGVLEGRSQSDTLQAEIAQLKDRIKNLKDDFKRVLFQMWNRVDLDLDDARSFVGDTALDIRGVLYKQNEDLFWDEYGKFKQVRKKT